MWSCRFADSPVRNGDYRWISNGNLVGIGARSCKEDLIWLIFLASQYRQSHLQISRWVATSFLWMKSNYSSMFRWMREWLVVSASHSLSIVSWMCSSFILSIWWYSQYTFYFFFFIVRLFVFSSLRSIIQWISIKSQDIDTRMPPEKEEGEEQLFFSLLLCRCQDLHPKSFASSPSTSCFFSRRRSGNRPWHCDLVRWSSSQHIVFYFCWSQ